MSVEVIDHSVECLRELREKTFAALDEIGAVAASHADENVVAAGRVDSGNLHNSITHRVVATEKAVYVGTNIEYAVYHELGSGTFAEGGRGRKGWWVYVPGYKGGLKSKIKNAYRRFTGKVYTEEQARRIVAIMRSKGIDAHMTQGIKPIHFLKHAAEDHGEEYRAIVKSKLKE